ncbi:MAG: retroviral-like aspartic protease [bacterium]|nr:retroviral-like aspartic protease [bacterium]
MKKEARRHESKVLPCYTKADIVTVFIAGKHKHARAFLDSGAQVCFITERLAKLLELKVIGGKHKLICIGQKKQRIEAYEKECCPLPVTLADHSVSTFNEYIPNVLLSYQGREIAVDMWICPNYPGEDMQKLVTVHSF